MSEAPDVTVIVQNQSPVIGSEFVADINFPVNENLWQFQGLGIMAAC